MAISIHTMSTPSQDTQLTHSMYSYGTGQAGARGIGASATGTGKAAEG